MALPRRRAHQVGNLRTELRDHARAMLEEAGLAQLSLRALAGRAGIVAASVYHHYDSKAALLAELAAVGFEELRADLDQAASTAPEGRRIRTCALAYFDFARRQPALYGLMFDPSVMEAEEVTAARQRAFAVLETLVADVATQQARPPEVAHKVALAVWACGHGAASMTLTQGGESDLMENVIQGLEALFRRS